MMKNFKAILLVVLCFCVNWVFAFEIYPDLDDDYCVGDDDSLLFSIRNKVANQSSYYTIGVPFLPNSHDDIIYIRINLIFMQRDDGSGNFNMEEEEYRIFWEDCVANLNSRYANLVNPTDEGCHVNSDFISDTKIQFIPNYIYVRDEYGWNNQHQKKY